MWQVEAPRHAVAHGYLMHEMLAFAAFHKVYKAQDVDARREYYTFGIHHQDCAIRGIRENIPKLIPDEAIAIVATSTLLTLSVFASTGFEVEFTPSPCAIDGLLNCFHLMQGMGNVLAVAHTIVQDSFLMSMFSDPPNVTPSQPLLAELMQHMPALTAFIQDKHDMPADEKTMFLNTVGSFGPVLAVSMPPKVDHRELRFLFYWPLHLAPEFLNAVRLRNSAAIAIIMYYATILLAAEPHFWFMKDWGQRVMQECYESIDQSWLPAIQWPLTFLNPDSTWRTFSHLAPHQDSTRQAGDGVYSQWPPGEIPHRDMPPGRYTTSDLVDKRAAAQTLEVRLSGPGLRPVIAINRSSTSSNSPPPTADKN